MKCPKCGTEMVQPIRDWYCPKGCIESCLELKPAKVPTYQVSNSIAPAKQTVQVKRGDWVEIDNDLPATGISCNDILQVLQVHNNIIITLEPIYTVNPYPGKITIDIDYFNQHCRILPRLERLRLTRRHWISP